MAPNGRIFIVAALAIQILMAAPAMAASSSSPIVKVTFASNPVTSAPGSSGYVQIDVDNTGSVALSDVRIGVASYDPGIVVDTGQTDIGGLSSGDTNSALSRFSVPQGAAAGAYKINYQITYCQDSSSVCSQTTQSAIVNVQSQPQVDIVSVAPSQLGLGTNSTLLMTVVNGGKSDATNVVITWSDPTGSILPLGSGNRMTIQSLSAGQSVAIPVSVITNPTATPKVYPVYFTIQYYDSSGQLQTVNSTIGLVVGGTTDFAVSAQDFTAGVLTLSIANIGINPATSVIVSSAGPGGQTQSSFVGSMNPGDSSVASFTVQQAGNRTTSVSVDISYTDTSGLRSEVTKTVSVMPQAGLVQGSAAQGARFQTRAGGFGFNEIVYIVVGLGAAGAAAYFLIRRRKKKH